MSGPAWFAGSFAVLMIVIAVYCAGRLALSRRRGKDTELDTDALHVLMGVAMAGRPALEALGTAACHLFLLSVGAAKGRSG